MNWTIELQSEGLLSGRYLTEKYACIEGRIDAARTDGDISEDRDRAPRP